MNDEGIEDLPMDSGPERPELVSEPSPIVDAPRDEHGRFASKDTGETAAEVEAPEAAQPKPGDNPIPEPEFKGYLTEKRKRQELEQEVAAMKAQLQQLTQQPEAPPSIWEDEEAARRYDNAQAVQTAVQQSAQETRLVTSEMFARREHPDFDELRDVFLGLAKDNPTLAQQALADPDPWGKAITIAKNHKAMQDLGTTDIAALLKAERAKWEAEAQAAIPRPRFPASTASDGSVSGRSAPVWTGDVNDRDILPMG